MGLEDTAIVQTQSLQKSINSPAKEKYLLRLVIQMNEPYYAAQVRSAVKAFNNLSL